MSFAGEYVLYILRTQDGTKVPWSDWKQAGKRCLGDENEQLKKKRNTISDRIDVLQGADESG